MNYQHNGILLFTDRNAIFSHYFYFSKFRLHIVVTLLPLKLGAGRLMLLLCIQLREK